VRYVSVQYAASIRLHSLPVGSTREPGSLSFTLPYACGGTHEISSNILVCVPTIPQRDNKEQESDNLSEPPFLFPASFIVLVATKGEFNVDKEEDVESGKAR
jgi:hypothetical protein